MKAVTADVKLIAWTSFDADTVADTGWDPDDDSPHNTGVNTDWNANGSDLAEFAGRACYQSWSKPNAKTATNKGYLQHILDVQHHSVLEHGSATFYITGVSRSLTHELVRHRHFSYSQLSQRYVDSSDINYVIPPEMRGNSHLEAMMSAHMSEALQHYDFYYEAMKQQLEEGVSGTEARKRARQAARCVLPNMTETRIVVTGNYRALRHFIHMRAAAPADVEIREVAVMVYRHLQRTVPNIVQDMRVITLADGTEAVLTEADV